MKPIRKLSDPLDIRPAVEAMTDVDLESIDAIRRQADYLRGQTDAYYQILGILTDDDPRENQEASSEGPQILNGAN